MEEKAINHLIAECLGWKFVPDFCADLNACAEMEEQLTNLEIGNYAKQLASVIDAETIPPVLWPSLYYFIHASPPHRCEAFLKVKGRWKE